MAGKIKDMIDYIIAQRSKGNETIALTTKTKLVLKGVNPDAYHAVSEDDQLILNKLKTIAVEFGITVK